MKLTIEQNYRGLTESIAEKNNDLVNFLKLHRLSDKEFVIFKNYIITIFNPDKKVKDLIKIKDYEYYKKHLTTVFNENKIGLK